jgi:GntR family transcriptional regulator
MKPSDADSPPPSLHLVDGRVPKHTQLREILVDLAENHLGPDARIPSERELTDRYGVSRITVREAVGQLVAEGRLTRIHGQGTFVARERVVSALHLASFTDEMRRRGLDPATLVRSVTEETPSPATQAALGLADGETTWRVERLRLAGGTPMALDIGWYPTRLLPGLVAQDLSGSLYSLMATKYGLVIDAAEQTVWAESADRRTANELGVLPAAPLMLFRRTSSAGGTRVEHITSWYRGDRYQVHLSLTRTPQ